MSQNVTKIINVPASARCINASQCAPCHKSQRVPTPSFPNMDTFFVASAQPQIGGGLPHQ